MKENIVEITRSITKDQITVSVSVHTPALHKARGEVFQRVYTGQVEYEQKEQHDLPFIQYRVTYIDRKGEEHFFLGASPDQVLYAMWKVVSDDARSFVKKVLTGQRIRGRMNWPTWGFSSDSFLVSLW